MNVVNTKEFNAHQEMYFDMALKDRVIIRRGSDMLIVQGYVPDEEPDMIFAPDEDFHASISMEEVRDRLHRVIDRLYAKE
jgi:hypothetical protein